MRHKTYPPKKNIKFVIAGLFLVIFISSNFILAHASVNQQATSSPFPTLSSCTSWNLASDFRISPNQENPNRDSCGNLNVWELMGSADFTHDPATYYILASFIPGTGGYPGLDFWVGTYIDSNGSFPAIGFNGSGATRVFYGHITFPNNAVDVHPAPSQMGIIAWHSPLSGYVSITGGVSDNDPACGDGILWYIAVSYTHLRAHETL